MPSLTDLLYQGPGIPRGVPPAQRTKGGQLGDELWEELLRGGIEQDIK